jgi:hypothetical protein
LGSASVPSVNPDGGTVCENGSGVSESAKILPHDYVVMKDHIHLLITPSIPIDKAVQLIKGGFSFRAGKEFGLTGRI